MRRLSLLFLTLLVFAAVITNVKSLQVKEPAEEGGNNETSGDESSESSSASSSAEQASDRPIITANANEITTITGDVGSVADPENDNLERELKEVQEIERRRRREQMEKRTSEQTLKAAENDKKSQHKQDRQEKLKLELQRNKEDNEKLVKEQEEKDDAKFRHKEEQSQKMEQAKLDALAQKKEVAKEKAKLEKKTVELKEELANKRLDEEKLKVKERQAEGRNEEERKALYRDKHLQNVQEMKAKQEAIDNADALDKINRKKRVIKRTAFKHTIKTEHEKGVADLAAGARSDAADEQKQKADKSAEEARAKDEELKQEMEKRREANKGKVGELKQELDKAAKEHSDKLEVKKKDIQADDDKNAKTAVENFNKAKKKHGHVLWCNCKAVDANWNNYNTWINCPQGFLITAMFRQSHHDLSAITGYRCCQPCAADDSVMETEHCATRDWVHSFDYAGWSTCHGHEYIQGFYKSSCNWIYCLEYASCCKIQDSPGWRDCTPVWRWGHGFDNPGWQTLDPNYFLAGLFRSHDHYLFNIEFPYECMARLT